MSDDSRALRTIAFFLPQFHPVHENDAWWGKGFTEWTNVVRAQPRFPGHYQPHIPADLGFYDLRLPDTREAQAELAREYGVSGFCYYHYWFTGRRILERPVNEILASGRPDFPFCLCWANENWTRRWDGAESHLLLSQEYSDADDLAHIESLFPAFCDPRYIRVNGKPLFLVYRTELLPDPRRTAELWRGAAQKAGIGELYLVRVESKEPDIDPRPLGFDAAVEFAPDWKQLPWYLRDSRKIALQARLGMLPKAYADNLICEYDEVAAKMLAKPAPDYKRFPGVAPSWDNSARRSSGAVILRGATPEKYENWLRENSRRVLERFQGEERLLFINAWNEWAEGCHLEPDLKHGRAYLEATRRALEAAKQ